MSTQKMIALKWMMINATHQIAAHRIILGVILDVQTRHSVWMMRAMIMKKPVA